MNQKLSKKCQAYFFPILLTFLTVTSAMSLAAFDMTGKTVTIYDGAVKKTVRTHAKDARDTLFAADIALGEHDTFWSSTDQMEDGSIIVVERAVPVVIHADGKTETIYTTQQTVQGAVNEAGFDWREMMPLEDGMTLVKSGMNIHVVPYQVRTSVKKTALPVSYVKWYDPSLSAEDAVVLDPGRAGQQMVTYEEVVAGGKVIRSQALKSEILDEGLEGSMKVGTLDGTVGQVLHMTATAYHPSDGDGAGITATGTRAGYGTIAVDPSTIPLGTSVYIPGYGSAVAADTGGAIQGNRVDLCMETFEECYNFGVRNVEVYISH